VAFLGDTSLRIDEVSTSFIARLPAGEILARWGGMPVLYLTTKFFLGAWDHPLALLLPSVLEGILGVAAVILLGAALAGAEAGLLAGALTALSPLAIYYSRDARFYPLFMLLSTLATLFLVRGLETRCRRWWVLFTLTSFLNLANQAAAALVLAGHCLAGSLTLLGGRPRSREEWREAARGLRPLAFAALLAGSAWLLLFLAPLGSMDGGRFWQKKFLPARETAVLARESLVGEGTLRMLANSFGGTDWTPLSLAVLAAALVWGFFRPRLRPLFLGLVFLPPALLLAARSLKWEDRYFIFALPLLLISLAEAWTALAGRIARNRRRLHAGILFLLPPLLLLAGLGTLADLYRKPKQPWREAAGLLREGGTRDLVVVPGPREAEALLYYLNRRQGLEVTRAHLDDRFRHAGYLLDWREPELRHLGKGELRGMGRRPVWRLRWHLRVGSPRVERRWILGQVRRGMVVITFSGTRHDISWSLRQPGGRTGNRLPLWRRLADAARRQAPRDPAVLILLAELDLAEGRREEARARLGEAAGAARRTVTGEVARGLLLLLDGRVPQGREAIARALARDPYNVRAILAAEGRALLPAAEPFFFGPGGR
jgi:hypothetical protein